MRFHDFSLIQNVIFYQIYSSYKYFYMIFYTNSFILIIPFALDGRGLYLILVRVLDFSKLTLKAALHDVLKIISKCSKCSMD